jgi:hypothetical protein
MGKIRRWLDRRYDRLEKTGSPEVVRVDAFVEALSSELGQEAADAFAALVKSKSPSIMKRMSKGMDVLRFVESYLTDPKFAQEINHQVGSNFEKCMLRKSCERLASETTGYLNGLSLSDLSKAVKAKDWNRVAKKQHPDAHLTVDHAAHLKQFPVHADYGKLLASPEKVAAHDDDSIGGISAKMVRPVHKPPVYTDIYMAKPYHKKLEYHTKSWVKAPITGWATMATKVLFNAGKIGHLAEDVSAHEHEGVPLTVHKFAKDHKPIGSLMVWQPRGGYRIERTVNPSDVHKIGVMDYLANNLDRHQGNLMVGSHSDARGYDPVLAIDHERNFQYHKPIKDSAMNRRQRMMFGGAADQSPLDKETPWAYIKGSVLNHAQNSAGGGWHSHQDLVDWWNGNGGNIRDEMENQLSSVKDETLRKHIRSNFMDRWHKMDQWAKSMAADPDSDHMYNQESLGNTFESARIKKPETPRISAKSIRSLPKDKRDAMFAIADMVNRKPNLTYNQTHMLRSALENILDSMTPEEAASAFKSLAGNPYMETEAVRSNPDVDPKNRMLRHFWEMKGYDKDNNPVYKVPHMEAIANAIDEMPEDKKEMLKSWAESYRSRIAGQRGAA